MMAKKKSKYPTSFDTYEEFEKVFDFIPAKDRYEWAENLDPNLLRIENEDGWTVAHELARKGTLPKKWITEELLRVEDNELGTTIAHELAYSGTLPEEFITDNLLRIKDWVGWTVAHELAWEGTFPKEKITDELLRVKNNDGLTVAHSLAQSGTLPEKFVTDELLRMKDKYGRTVAGCCCIFLSRNNRWDLLTPMLLDVPYNNSNTLVITKLDKDLSGMSDSKLEEALSVMPGETQMKLLSDIKNPDLLERIRKCLDRELENEAFETSPDEEPDLYTGGQEELYGAEVER